MCIASESQTENVKPGTKCVLIGWGKTSTSSDYAQILQEVAVPIVDTNQCFQKYKDQIDPKTSICAGSEEGGIGGCGGDGGGPLMCKMENSQWCQIGIASTIYPCALPGKPDVYTRVSSFHDWMGEIMSSN